MKLEEAVMQLKDLQKDRKSFMSDKEEKDSIFMQDYEAIEIILSELERLQEYKRLSELTKIACCSAQNCGALNNAIREGIENQKLKKEIEQLKIELDNANKCLHCGTGKPAYCEECFQKLITENFKLQSIIKEERRIISVPLIYSI